MLKKKCRQASQEEFTNCPTAALVQKQKRKIDMVILFYKRRKKGQSQSFIKIGFFMGTIMESQLMKAFKKS